jgi:hypothetical protein
MSCGCFEELLDLAGTPNDQLEGSRVRKAGLLLATLAIQPHASRYLLTSRVGSVDAGAVGERGFEAADLARAYCEANGAAAGMSGCPSRARRAS